jgi:hypothetical protein
MASDRVLYNRTAHSHLSIRMLSMPSVIQSLVSPRQDATVIERRGPEVPLKSWRTHLKKPQRKPRYDSMKHVSSSDQTRSLLSAACNPTEQIPFEACIPNGARLCSPVVMGHAFRFRALTVPMLGVNVPAVGHGLTCRWYKSEKKTFLVPW